MAATAHSPVGGLGLAPPSGLEYTDSPPSAWSATASPVLVESSPSPAGPTAGFPAAKDPSRCHAAATGLPSDLLLSASSLWALSPSPPAAASDGWSASASSRKLSPPPPAVQAPEPALPAVAATPGGPSPLSGGDPGGERMWCLDDFELGPRIGSGSFGHVRLVRERRNKIVAALKVMKKRRIERLKVQRHVAHEIEIQAHLRHPNILGLFGFFWDAGRIYVILEHAPGGDLQGLCKKTPGEKLEEATAAAFVAQVVSALEYCHRMHVIHRDVKPQNLLVGRGRRLKLADFGWAVHTYPDERRWTLCGTLDYLPPEMVYPTVGHSFGVDIWGLGVLACELSAGQPPFAATSCQETYQRILAAARGIPQEFWRGLSQHAQDFAVRLLQREPAERLRLDEAAAHPWLAQHGAKGLAPPDCAPNPSIAAFAGA